MSTVGVCVCGGVGGSGGARLALEVRVWGSWAFTRVEGWEAMGVLRHEPP